MKSTATTLREQALQDAIDRVKAANADLRTRIQASDAVLGSDRRDVTKGERV